MEVIIAILPIFDILFGTFNNPGVYKHEAGFHIWSSAGVKDMLLFRDITAPPINSRVKEVKVRADQEAEAYAE